jgi:phage shock protein PspC (stress-responsive transcriptional regulator)
MRRSGKNFLLPARPHTGRLIAGVCMAVANRFTADVTLIRFGFLLLTLVWGFGLVLYGILWVVMPEPEGAAVKRVSGPFSRTVRGMHVDLGRTAKWFSNNWQSTDKGHWLKPHNWHWMAVGIVISGLIIFFASLGAFEWLNATRAFGLAIVAIGLSLIVVTRGRK